MSDVHIYPDSADGRAEARLGRRRWRCVLGRGGTVPAARKREGDRCTPEGRFSLDGLMWRADRGTLPPSSLPSRRIEPHHGWCDDPRSPHYNRLVDARLFARRCEALWREDHRYDLLIIPGHNREKRRRTRGGSAIFVHLADSSMAPTLGCIALERQDLTSLIPLLTPASRLIVHPPDQKRTPIRR